MTLNKPTYHNLRLAAATALAGAALAACSAFHEPEIPCPEPEPEARTPLALTFNVTTQTGITASRAAAPFSSLPAPLAAASRADSNPDHYEEGSDYPDTEDYLNLNDFGFFIFAGEEKRLLYMNTNVIASSGDALDMSITGSSGNYTVSLILDDELVEALLGGGALSPSGDRTMPLTIAVIANHNASRLTPGFDNFKDLTAATAENVGGASTLNDFISIAEGMTFTPAASDENLLIPMYGISSFTLTEPQMYYSRPDDRIELGEISLLRAMCKIRVIDQIQNKTGGYPRVTAARISYPQTGGYVTPRTPADYQNGQQIHGNQEALPDITGQTTRDLRTGTVVANSLVSYAPAQPLTVTAPEVVISVQRDAESAAQEFTVNLLSRGDYGYAVADWGDMMLRNHVYTLAVQGVTFGASLTLTATVADWEESTFRFDYTDGVSKTDGGEIKWDDGTWESKNLATSTLTLKPWSATGAQPTRFTFGLATPKGAQWIASLINTEGDASALVFMPEEGLTLSDDGKSISGTVPAKGSQAISLRITSTIEKPTVTSADKLQIVVATQGGTAWAVATTKDILGDWTVVQKQQEI